MRQTFCTSSITELQEADTFVQMIEQTPTLTVYIIILAKPHEHPTSALKCVTELRVADVRSKEMYFHRTVWSQDVLIHGASYCFLPLQL